MTGEGHVTRAENLPIVAETSVGAGDPGFEITPAMIKAGAEVLCSHYLDLVDVVDGAREAVVKEIILATVGLRGERQLSHPNA